MSRLDYFITSVDIISWTEKCEILPGYGSDHYVITLEFDPINVDWGRGVGT